MPGVSRRRWKWLWLFCYGVLIANALFVMGGGLYDFATSLPGLYHNETAVSYKIGWAARSVIVILFVIAVYSYSILTAVRRKQLHSLMIYGGLTIVLSLRLSDLHPRASLLLVVSSFFSIAILTVYFLATGPTKNWYGTKASLKVFGTGFVSAIVLTMASLWLNTHHGPAGSTTIVVPAWLISRHTFYGGCVLGVLVQVYSLVAAARLYLGQVEKKNRIALLVLLWIGLLILSLAVWSYGASIARASWFV